MLEFPMVPEIKRTPYVLPPTDSAPSLPSVVVTPSQEPVQQAFFFTGFLPGTNAKIQFYPNLSGRESPIDFFAEKKMTERQIFDIFCQLWKRDFVNHDIVTNYALYFYPLGVREYQLIVAINHEDDKLFFEFEVLNPHGKSTEIERKKIWKKWFISEISQEIQYDYRVQMDYRENGLKARKESLYYKCEKNNNKTLFVSLPFTPNPLTRKRPLLENLRQSMDADYLLPDIVKQIAFYAVKEVRVSFLSASTLQSLRGVFQDAEDDYSPVNANNRCETPVEKTPAIALDEVCELEELIGVLSMSQDDVACAAFKKKLREELSKKNEKGEKKYEEIKTLLELSFFPYMKQSLVVFLFLEHLIPLVADKSENKALYKIMQDWLDQYRETYFSREFDLESSPFHLEAGRYGLSEVSKKVLNENVYQETLYSPDYPRKIVVICKKLIELYDRMMGAGERDNIIQLTLQEKNMAMHFDNGLILNLPSDLVFDKLRKDKIKEGNLILKKNIDISMTINAQHFVFPSQSTDILTTMSLSSEEQIAMFVSFLVVESDLSNERYDIEFKNKLDNFFDNESNAKIFHKKKYLKKEVLDLISYYIARNARPDLTLDHKEKLIKTIYNNVLPNSNHQANREDFIAHLQEESRHAVMLGEKTGHAFLAECYRIMKPSELLSSMDLLPEHLQQRRNKLNELTNMVKALQYAGLLLNSDETNLDLIHRRECAVEAIFHALMDKMYPLGKEAYIPLSYTDDAIYFEAIENCVKESFTKTDAYIRRDKEVQLAVEGEKKASEAHKKNPKRQHTPQITNVLDSANIETSNSEVPASPERGLPKVNPDDPVARASYLVSRKNKLAASLRAMMRSVNKGIWEALANDDAEAPSQANKLIEHLNENQISKSYVLGDTKQEAFDQFCDELQNKMDRIKGDLPVQVDKITVARKATYHLFIKGFNDRISAISNEIIQHSDLNKKINRDAFIDALRLKVDFLAESDLRDKYIHGDSLNKNDVFLKKCHALKSELDECVSKEMKRIEALEKARKKHFEKNIQKLEKSISDIHGAYFHEIDNVSEVVAFDQKHGSEPCEKVTLLSGLQPLEMEALVADEYTSDYIGKSDLAELITSIFGKNFIKNLNDERLNIVVNKSLYAIDRYEASSIVREIESLEKKIEDFHAFIQFYQNELDWLASKVKYMLGDESVHSSTVFSLNKLSLRQQGILERYQQYRQLVEGRNIFWKFISYLGFWNKLQKQNQAYKKADDEASVIALMLHFATESTEPKNLKSLDRLKTEANLSLFEDLDAMKTALVNVTACLKNALPVQKTRLYQDAKNRLALQIAQLEIKRAVNAMQSDPNHAPGDPRDLLNKFRNAFTTAEANAIATQLVALLKTSLTKSWESKVNSVDIRTTPRRISATTSLQIQSSALQVNQTPLAPTLAQRIQVNNFASLSTMF